MKRQSRSRSLLSALFPRLRPGEFAEKYFPSRPMIAHGPVARFGSLAQEPRLRDPMATIDAGKGDPVLAYLGTANGRRHQAFLGKESAKAMFKDGVNVSASWLHETIDVVGQWVQNISDELGLGPGLMICDGIISPPGDAVPKHFDGIETLTVQLTGCKRWRIAPCLEAAFPYHSAFPALAQNWRDGSDPHGKIPRAFSSKMPKGARTVMMRPGSVCFLPRGWWHETESLAPSISLSFVLRTESWANRLSAAFLDRLMETPQFRAPVPVATPGQRAAARRATGEVLKAAAALLVQMTPEALLPAAPAARRFRPVAGADLAWTRARKASRSWKILVSSPASGQVQLEVDEGVAGIVRWISARRAPFSLRQLAAATKPHDPARVVDTLIEAGYLGAVDQVAQTQDSVAPAL
jgi:ribosomal protein L16 Arg81 hydroxylase